MTGFAEDYNDVASRIGEFREKYPEGTLRPADLAVPYRLLEVDGTVFVVVVAAAYRTADDPTPGIGMAQEQIPGKSNFTRGSELQNAETSAWGRAIIAVGAADAKKGVASADEVRNRQADRDNPVTPVTDHGWVEGFRSRVAAVGTHSELAALVAEAIRVYGEGRLTKDDANDLKALTDEREAELGGVLV